MAFIHDNSFANVHNNVSGHIILDYCKTLVNGITKHRKPNCVLFPEKKSYQGVVMQIPQSFLDVIDGIPMLTFGFLAVLLIAHTPYEVQRQVNIVLHIHVIAYA